MTEIGVMLNALTHVLYRHMTGVVGSGSPRLRSDRGAVSLEQVLWFVAAGVSVAVVAGIMWGQIRTRANATISNPVAP